MPECRYADMSVFRHSRMSPLDCLTDALHEGCTHTAIHQGLTDRQQNSLVRPRKQGWSGRFF
ncbi:MAG: hypothetical protein WA151_19230 [Desulfatirhabdiaceae bacterium]